MASKIAEKAPGWVTRILLPEIAEMKGELKNINTRIDALDSKIDSVRNELKADIARVESKVQADIARLESKVQADIARLESIVLDLDKRLDIVQRLSVLEVKVREKEERK